MDISVKKIGFSCVIGEGRGKRANVGMRFWVTGQKIWETLE